MADRDRRKLAQAQEIPAVIEINDKYRSQKYRRGKFLGKGGFAKCYELHDLIRPTSETVAGKIVPKALLTKQHQRDKMTQEITLHKTLDHKYVVKLMTYFEDSSFVYIVLELCRRRSLMELHKRRKAITEPETRYFMKQILLGVQYLHEKKIIHRDLKLGNIFLNDNMEIKIGDFGLATMVGYDGERKRTLCGTPNYIAPEVLGKKGHSFEVDIWSIGCILYTLLVGKPPFETETLKDTYNRIKKNEYHVPIAVGSAAKAMISRLLQHDPAKRPTVIEALKDLFIISGYCPSRLPTSCLTMAPRFDRVSTMPANGSNIVSSNGRGPLAEINGDMKAASSAGGKKPSQSDADHPADCHLAELHKQLRSLVDTEAHKNHNVFNDEAEDPQLRPMVWVSKWVDYSDKYGFGYALSDDSIGVLFNDVTRLLLLEDGHNIHYIDYEANEHYYTLVEFPPSLEKKVKLLNYFKNYMKEHLLKAGAGMETKEGDEFSRIPSMRTWFRTSRAVIMHLTNGTLQINFFKDHTKIILCPLVRAVTYIDPDKKHTTYSFDLIQKLGYALDKVQSMINRS